jgi:putative ABC transport system permease protein
MLKLRSPEAGFALDQQFNKQGKVATLAYPIGNVLADLFSKLGWVTRVLRVVAWLVMIVAAASILASVYNTIHGRRRDFAILRALGARKSSVLASVVFEAGTIAALGALAGFLVYAVILLAAGAVIRQQTGVVIEVASLPAALLLVPVGMIVLGTLAGVVPAIKAYETDVATNLAPAT